MNWLKIIERALPYGDYTLEEIEDKVESGQWQKWQKGDNVILTEIWHGDGGRALSIQYAAGNIEELPLFMPVVESYAMEEGCKYIYLSGRPGWSRALQAYGYQQTNQLRKEL